MSAKHFRQVLSNVGYYDKKVQQHEDILFFGFFQMCRSFRSPAFDMLCQSQDKIPA